MVIKTDLIEEPLEVLRRLQGAGFKSAIIAGGAIRDLYHDVSIRDIDIFIMDEESEETTERIKPLNSLNPGARSYWSMLFGTDSKRVTLKFDGSIAHKIEMVTRIIQVRLEHYTYEIISVNSNPTEYVKEHFDIGLCKCLCDGIKFSFLSDFLNDSKNKTLTVCAPEHISQRELDHIMNSHLPKLKVKYPGFSVQVAPHLSKKFLKYQLKKK